jgi:hypothetical protein
MSWITDPISTRPRAEAELTADRSRSLVDKFLDSRIRWLEACEDVRSAYERWRTCDAPERDLAFATYHAALDREDHAARVHSLRTARLRAAES